MGKPIDETISVEMHAGAVRDKLTDAAHIHRMAMAAGASRARAEIDGNTSIIVRTIEVPAGARALLRADAIDVTERREWSAFGAEISVTVENVDVKVAGRLELKETGTHCVMRLTATVSAHMGFASPLVENLVRDKLVEQFVAEAEGLRAY